LERFAASQKLARIRTPLVERRFAFGVDEWIVLVTHEDGLHLLAHFEAEELRHEEPPQLGCLRSGQTLKDRLGKLG
jgi:hypothetical protein